MTVLLLCKQASGHNDSQISNLAAYYLQFAVVYYLQCVLLMIDDEMMD